MYKILDSMKDTKGWTKMTKINIFINNNEKLIYDLAVGGFIATIIIMFHYLS